MHRVGGVLVNDIKVRMNGKDNMSVKLQISGDGIADVTTLDDLRTNFGWEIKNDIIYGKGLMTDQNPKFEISWKDEKLCGYLKATENTEGSYDYSCVIPYSNAMKPAISFLKSYIDVFLEQNNVNAEQVYSDHVQVKRKINPDLTVYTCNASFAMMAAALRMTYEGTHEPQINNMNGLFQKIKQIHSKFDESAITYTMKVKDNTEPVKCKTNFGWSNVYFIDECEMNKNEIQCASFASEQLLVNALLNSEKNLSNDLFETFLHTEVNHNLNSDEFISTNNCIVCVQESLVGYFIQKPEVWTDKYLCVCSESPKDEKTAEGSTILIKKNTFEWDDKFITQGKHYIWCNCGNTKSNNIETVNKEEDKKHANFVYLGVRDQWNVCNVNGRAWSYAVVKETTTPKKKYMIINLHGAHPITDYDKPAIKLDGSTNSDKTFGQTQPESVQNWLNNICKNMQKGDGDTYRATVDGIDYTGIHDIIVAGDFNDEIRSLTDPKNHDICNNNNILCSKDTPRAVLADDNNKDYRGRVRLEMGEMGGLKMQQSVSEEGEQLVTFGTPKDIKLYSLLSNDVHSHDARVTPPNIFPTNGHLARDKETRAAVDMIWHIDSDNDDSVHNMKAASSKLPTRSYIQDSLSKFWFTGFNQLYEPKPSTVKGFSFLDMDVLSKVLADRAAQLDTYNDKHNWTLESSGEGEQDDSATRLWPSTWSRRNVVRTRALTLPVPTNKDALVRERKHSV